MAEQIISRVVAVILLSFPLAYLMSYFQEEEQRALATMSHAELIGYIRAGFVSEQYVWVVLVFGFGLLYVGVVEGCAYVLRWAWRQFSGSQKAR